MCGQGTPHAVSTPLSAPLCCRTTGLKMGGRWPAFRAPRVTPRQTMVFTVYSSTLRPPAYLVCVSWVVAHLHAKRAAQPLRRGPFAISGWRAAKTVAATCWCWLSRLQPLWHLLRNMYFQFTKCGCHYQPVTVCAACFCFRQPGSSRAAAT